MYVVKHETFPGNCIEHSYQEGEIKIVNGIAVVQHVETKDYMFKLGYELVGEIEHPSQLEALLAGKLKKEEETAAPVADVGPDLARTMEKILDPLGQTPQGDYWWQK